MASHRVALDEETEIIREATIDCVKMPISVNPLDILKLFREKGITDKAKVASYVEAVAADVLEASELWCEAIDAAERGDLLARTKIWRRIHTCESINDHYKRSVICDSRPPFWRADRKVV